MNDLLSRWVLFQAYYPAISVVLMCAFKSAAIVFVGWILAGFIVGRSAAARCWLWRVILVACLVLPLFDLGPTAIRRLRLVWPQQTSAANFHAFGEEAQAWRLVRSDDEIAAIRHKRAADRLEGARDLAPWERERIEREPFSMDDVRPTPWRQIEDNVYVGWWLVAGVLVGVLMLRVAVSSWHLMKKARVVADDLHKEAFAAAERLGIKRDVRVRLLEGARSPLMAGWLRPSVYLPESSAGWSFSSREAVFLHELAHWKRGDHFWQL
ncbi:MAG: M56 family metallopeptidase [Opitutaceae bacterium]|jgi:beta-lactamase regulating signal transducer with metallopeptidase domain